MEERANTRTRFKLWFRTPDGYSWHQLGGCPEQNYAPSGDRFLNGDRRLGDLDQLFEGNWRRAASAHCVYREFNLAFVTLITPHLGALGFSVAGQFQGAKVTNSSDLSLAKYLELLFRNRSVAIGQI